MSKLPWSATIVVIVAGCVCAAGGAPAAAVPSLIDPFSYAQPSTPAALSASGRLFAAAAGDAGGTRVVMYGGDAAGNSAAHADTWINEANGVWRPTCGATTPGATAACGPGPRDALGMANAPGGVVLYGGFSGDLGGSPPNGDTWRWTGSTWTRVCTAATCGPGPRALMAMAGNGSTALMFGGIGGSGSANDTWIFDGHSWTESCGQAGVPCGPTGLAGASMAWDGHNFILFGGAEIGANTPPVDDTWAFNGRTWTKVCGASSGKPCGPSARDLAAFAFAGTAVAPRAAMMAEGGDLFGSGATQHLDRDAWLFDGARWTELDPPWKGSVESYPNNGAPPAGPDPLLGVMAPKPALCELVYLGNVVARTGHPPTIVDTTFRAGRAPWSAAKPNCLLAAAAPPPTATTTTTTRPAPAPNAGPSPTVAPPSLPATGATAPGIGTASGIALVAVGLVLSGLRIRRRSSAGFSLRRCRPTARRR